jgi:hypothetical protein
MLQHPKRVCEHKHGQGRTDGAERRTCQDDDTNSYTAISKVCDGGQDRNKNIIRIAVESAIRIDEDRSSVLHETAKGARSIWFHCESI